MIRKIIHINEEKCNGCGLCATACHEGAIEMVDGKAKLTRESFCDGLGDCLPQCPTAAITFEEREAPAYDEAAVKAAQASSVEESGAEVHVSNSAPQHENSGGCPGSRMRILKSEQHGEQGPAYAAQIGRMQMAPSRLQQWPCQIKLVHPQAPFFDGAKLLIAADCTAYAYARMHEDFMKGKVTLIGCPKLDDTDYSEKLCDIIAHNDIRSVTIVRMEVPCCSGLQRMAEIALEKSGKFIPWQVVTISCDGEIFDA